MSKSGHQGNESARGATTTGGVRYRNVVVTEWKIGAVEVSGGGEGGAVGDVVTGRKCLR